MKKDAILEELQTYCLSRTRWLRDTAQAQGFFPFSVSLIFFF